MARLTDHTKIERLKHATMKLVVERGFGGASAALIAKEAGVASGYFYMHYKGKYQMVNAILHEVYNEFFGCFEQLISSEESFAANLERLVRHSVAIANASPIKVKFLYVLTNDYSFVIDPAIREKTFSLVEQLRNIGLERQELDPALQVDDLYLILIATTLQYINLKYKHQRSEVVSEDDIQHLLMLFLKFFRAS